MNEFEKFNVSDEVGNKLVCSEDGNLRLELKDSKYNKNPKIGQLKIVDGKMCYSKNVDEKNIMRINDSWGLCWDVISKLKDDDIVALYGKKRDYFLTVKIINEKKDFLHFKTKGLEKQIFIPIKYWTNPNEIIINIDRK